MNNEQNNAIKETPQKSKLYIPSYTMPIYYQNLSYSNNPLFYYQEGFYYHSVYPYYPFCHLNQDISKLISEPNSVSRELISELKIVSPPVDEISDELAKIKIESPSENNLLNTKKNKSKKGKFVDLFNLEDVNFSESIKDTSKKEKNMDKTISKSTNQKNFLNILDSTAPKNYPGKKNERGRLTTLKKVIIRERNRPNEDNDEDNSLESDIVVQQAKSLIHSDKFREYCDHFTTIEIDEVVSEIVERLKFFQNRNMQKNSYKAKTKLRFTLGIREVIKHLSSKRIRLLLVAPNIENIKDKGGLNDCINKMLTMCKEQNVPYVFTLSRHRLGKLISNRIPASIIGVFDYSGVEQSVARLQTLTEISKKAYNESLNKYIEELRMGKDVPNKLKIDKSHNRQISDGSAVSFSSSIMSKPLSQYVGEPGSAKNAIPLTSEISKSDTLNVSDIICQNHLRNNSNCSAISDISDVIKTEI